MADWQSKYFIKDMRELLDHDIDSYPIDEWIARTEWGLKIVKEKYRSLKRIHYRLTEELEGLQSIVLDATLEGLEYHNKKVRKLANKVQLLSENLLQLISLINEYEEKLKREYLKIDEEIDKRTFTEDIKDDENIDKKNESQSLETELEIDSTNESSNKKSKDIKQWLRNNFFIVCIGILILIIYIF